MASTTLKVPINLLSEEVEIHEANSRNESKIKFSSKNRKNPRKFKKKSTGSRTSETKTDEEEDEPTTTEPTEPVTVQLTEPRIIESSTESTQSTAETAVVMVVLPKKRSRPPAVPDTNSENLETPLQHNKIRSSDSNANDQSTTSEATESNQNKRHKLDRKSGTNDHENLNAIKQSNQDTLNIAFESTTIFHINWIDTDGCNFDHCIYI